MKIEERYICHGDVDATKLRQAVLACPEKLWSADDGLKNVLAKSRPTQSLFLLRLGSAEIYDALRRRPLLQTDVPKHSAWRVLQSHVTPILNKILSLYPKNGVFVSVQIARLPAGAKIEEHIDRSQLLLHSHRLHVPLVTYDEIDFIIDGERVDLKQDQLYEINNGVTHGVENYGDQDRLHLIIDYLPPERNNQQHFCMSSLKRQVNNIASRYEQKQLPKLVATSVVRGAEKAESHGGIYLVDMQSSEVEQAFDWNTGDIDFQGRGWDRGLRGIAFHGEDTYIAASDELFKFDQHFNIKASYKNPYLKHAHEMSVYQDKLFITSTGYDSILRFDLKNKTFDHALSVKRAQNKQLTVGAYDPNTNDGPKFENTTHINQVHCDKNGLYVGGRRMQYLLHLKDGEASKYCQLPNGVHNAQPYRSGVLLNDTESENIVFFDEHKYTEVAVPAYADDELLNMQLSDSHVAKPSFGRGMCVSNDNIVFAGSSPSTISAYDLDAKRRFKSVNISMDVRNAIHGLAVWPF